MGKTIWTSDSDLNGLETVARIIKVEGEYFLEVANKEHSSLKSRIKAAWKVLTGKMVLFSFVILSDKDTWVRRVENGRENSESK